MHLAVQTLFDFASTIAVLALLAVPYGMARDRLADGPMRDSLLGLLFGLSAVGAMLDPFVLADGLMFDMRNLPVGLAGAFLGPIGALAAMVPAALMRLAIGGTGVAPALAAIAIAGGAGVIWRSMGARVAMGRLGGPLVLGAMISLHLVSLAGLPHEVTGEALRSVAPIIVLLNLAGALVTANLIRREGQHVEQRHRLDLETVTDPLTGVANRRGFERRVRELARAGRGEGNAVLLIDVDHFKAINDRLGHAAGDAVLRQIGARLAHSVRGDDVVARIGGEEFAVYLADATREATGCVADRLRSAVADAPFAVAGGRRAVSVSVGVHWQAEPVADWDAILGVADRALYAAKAQGRDRVVFDDAPGMPAAA